MSCLGVEVALHPPSDRWPGQAGREPLPLAARTPATGGHPPERRPPVSLRVSRRHLGARPDGRPRDASRARLQRDAGARLRGRPRADRAIGAGTRSACRRPDVPSHRAVPASPRDDPCAARPASARGHRHGAGEPVGMGSDARRIPIAGARVEVPAIDRRSRTDADGRFRLDSIPSAATALRVRVTAKGREAWATVGAADDRTCRGDQARPKGGTGWRNTSLLTSTSRRCPPGRGPIQAVGTRTAGFVGQAPEDATPTAASARPSRSTTGPVHARVRRAASSASTPLSNAVFGFFENGGSRCFIVNTAETRPIAGGRDGGGLRRSRPRTRSRSSPRPDAPTRPRTTRC